MKYALLLEDTYPTCASVKEDLVFTFITSESKGIVLIMKYLRGLTDRLYVIKIMHSFMKSQEIPYNFRNF